MSERKETLSPLELQIMETLWTKGASSIRELQQAFPDAKQPLYTTVRTAVYRLEIKKAIRRTSKVRNAHVFEAVGSRNPHRHTIVDEIVALFGKPLSIAKHLSQTDGLTPEQVREARKVLRHFAAKNKNQGLR